MGRVVGLLVVIVVAAFILDIFLTALAHIMPWLIIAGLICGAGWLIWRRRSGRW